MKAGLKIAVLAACALPVAANAALVYTPPQAMVLTCNGSAPNVVKKTSALATFACKDGQTPQAVGITSGLGDLLGLATGAAVLAGSEAVPSLALPGTAQQVSGLPQSGNGSGNGSGAGNGSGNGSSSGNGSGSGNGSAGNGSGGSGSGNGSGNGSGDGSGNGSGNGAGNGSGSGGFLGNLLHSVGQAAQRIGGALTHTIETGQPTTVHLFGGPGGNGTAAANNTGNAANFNSLNSIGNSSGGPVSPMAGSKPGTIEIHSQPKAFTLGDGGDGAYRGLVQWVSQYEGPVLSIGGGYLDEVIHPESVVHERLPVGPSDPAGYYAFERMTGTVNFYITKLGHHYIAYPGNPVRITVNVPDGMGATGPAIWEASQKIGMQATTTYASGPQFFASDPGNRNGPFWPTPFTPGGPEPAIAGACHGLQQVTHVSMGGFCWSTQASEN